LIIKLTVLSKFKEFLKQKIEKLNQLLGINKAKRSEEFKIKKLNIPELNYKIKKIQVIVILIPFLSSHHLI
jgi:hypothetical protein